MDNRNKIIIFETKDKSISLPVRIENESVWLNERSNPPAMLGRME